MKHLLNGVAIAAALAIAAPAWAQTPMTPKSPAASAPMAPMASAPRHKRHMAMHHGMMSTTDQLNREELARIQGGGAAPMPAPAATGPYGQPNNTKGIPGAGTAPATSPTP